MKRASIKRVSAFKTFPSTLRVQWFKRSNTSNAMKFFSVTGRRKWIRLVVLSVVLIPSVLLNQINLKLNKTNHFAIGIHSKITSG